MTPLKKICVVTGTRADYGLLSPLIARIISHERFDLFLIVTAMHLSPEFGLTRNLIRADGIPISAEVDMLLSADTPSAVTKSLGLGLIGMSDALECCRPDLVVVLGDRFEALGVAVAAMIARVPVAHIHGGEITRGAIDESIRHAITKMSTLHFTSTEDYRRRVIQMGEPPDKVFNVGAIGLDRIESADLLTRTELESELGFRFGERLALVTYHPETMEPDSGLGQLSELLLALDDFPKMQVIMTYPNADAESREIIRQIETYAGSREKRVLLKKSLGDINYLSALALADIVVGNSSSAIIEAPSLRTASVNIGGRQEGRVAAASVQHCQGERAQIRAAIAKALSPEFGAIVCGVDNPYDKGGAADMIISKLSEASCEELFRKEFFDLDEVRVD